MALKCNGEVISDEKVREYLNTPVNVLTFLGNYFTSYGNYQLKNINDFLNVMPAYEAPAKILADLVNYDVLIKVKNLSTSEDYSIETPDNLLCGRWNPYQYLFDMTIPKMQEKVGKRKSIQEQLDDYVVSDSKVTEVNVPPKKKTSTIDFLKSFFVKV